MFCYFLKVCLSGTCGDASIFLLAGEFFKDCCFGTQGGRRVSKGASLLARCWGEKGDGREGKGAGRALVMDTAGRRGVKGDSWVNKGYSDGGRRCKWERLAGELVKGGGAVGWELVGPIVMSAASSYSCLRLIILFSVACCSENIPVNRSALFSNKLSLLQEGS